MEECGPAPGMLKLAHAVEVYGAQAVFGRTLEAREIAEMNVARSIRDAYNHRKASKDWAKNNPQGNELLLAAYRAAVKIGLFDGD